MSESVRFVVGVVPWREELRALYDAVGWSAYTDDLDALVRGAEGSAVVVTAWRGEVLVGLARVISDGHTIAYLQDVLVLPEMRRQGVASELVRCAFEPLGSVRQQVLLTDAEEGQRAFYASLGFRETREFPNGGLRAFVRLR